MSGDLGGHSISGWSFPDACLIQCPGNTVLGTLASPSGRNVNYDEKQLTEKNNFELFLLSVQVS